MPFVLQLLHPVPPHRLVLLKTRVLSLYNLEAMAKKRVLQPVGKTEDGKLVYAGVFIFYDRHGLPLQEIISCLEENNAVPCWVSFIKEADKQGWTRKATVSRIKEAIIDIHGPAYWKNFNQRLEKIQDKELI